MNKKGLIALSALVLVLLMGSVSATIIKGTNGSFIQKSYAFGEKIKGQINVSFANEPISSVFTSNLPGIISVIDFLKNNSYIEVRDYNCSIRGCLPSYAAGNAITTLNLNAASSTAGFKIGGPYVQVNDVRFTVSSNLQPSCRPGSFLIDVLDKRAKFVVNYETTGNSCAYEYTKCFDSTLAESIYTPAEISGEQYCENMTLPPAPSYKLGARVKNTTEGYSEIEINLLDSSYQPVDGCILPENTQDGVFEALSCVINYSSVKAADYFICISSADNSGYKIKTETSGRVCGTTETSRQFTRDYDVFANALEFGTINMGVNETSFYDQNGISLADYVDDYINDTYRRNCTDGCIVPFKFSGDSQILTFSNAEIEYTSDLVTLNSNDMFSIYTAVPKVTSKFLNLIVEKLGFTIPFGSTVQRFILNLGSTKVLDESINVSAAGSTSFDVLPRLTYIGTNTPFIIVAAITNISSYWNFGDGTTGTSPDNKIFHRYNSKGDYNIRVVLTRMNGSTLENNFTIVVTNASESAKRLIANIDTRLADARAGINALPAWIADRVKNSSAINSINASLAEAKKRFSNATNESDYESIVNSLITLDAPYNVSYSRTSTMPILAGYRSMNIDYLLSLVNAENVTSASDKQKLKDSIMAWVGSNYTVTIRQGVLSMFKDSGKEDLLTTFKINIEAKSGAVPVDFIISYPKEALVFKQSYSEASIDTGTYIPISGSKEIEFLIPGKVETADLGMYLAPEDIGQFEAQAIELKEFQQKSPAKLTIILLILLFLIFFVVYIVLQEWYKRHYETHLFKRPEFLMNIMKFIANSRTARLNDEDIKKKLLDAGWTKEQVSYAFNKVDGKRTGMFEIPVFRMFEKRNLQRELAKGPQPAGTPQLPQEMVRFIK